METFGKIEGREGYFYKGPKGAVTMTYQWQGYWTVAYHRAAREYTSHPYRKCDYLDGLNCDSDMTSRAFGENVKFHEAEKLLSEEYRGYFK